MTSIVEQAKTIALNAHEGQKYGENPYSVHLEEVVGVLEELCHGENEELVAAAWLHDVLEDTQIDQEYLLMYFPIYIVALVDAVTNQPGKNRKERFKLTYPRISRMEEAITLKLADRIANVRHCIKDGKTSLLQMYRREWPAFYRSLKADGYDPNSGAWEMLENLLGNPLK